MYKCTLLSRVHKRMVLCTRESSVHFDKTRLWFGFMFISFFTAATPSQSTHNPQMPTCQPCRSTNIPHLAEAWSYGCNGTYSTGRLPLLYIPKLFCHLITFSQRHCGWITATLHSKTSIYFHYFPQK
jgi:hypothetical protein